MAETTPSIATTKKEKDPRRLEAGKRLALITKQAKERKRIEREQRGKEDQLRREKEDAGVASNGLIIVALTGVGVVVAIVTLWYTRKEYNLEVQEKEENTPSFPHKEEDVKEGRKLDNL